VKCQLGDRDLQKLVSLSVAALFSQDGQQMEASPAAELQCAEQDKMDTLYHLRLYIGLKW